MLTYLLDTNICIYITKHRPISVLHHFERLQVGTVAMSLITYGELIYGAQRSNHTKKTLSILEELINLIPAIPLPIDASKHYGEVRYKLEKQGKIIGNNDLWIAAHALAAHLILVTNNIKEFARIPHLKLENWVNEK